MLSIGRETMPVTPHVMATLRTCTDNDPGMIRCGPIRPVQRIMAEERDRYARRPHS